MNDIVSILMRRDGMEKWKAQTLVNDTLDEIDEAIQCGESLEVLEDIVKWNLGLEPDYLEILLLNM